MQVWTTIVETLFSVQEDLSSVELTVRYPDGTSVASVTAVPGQDETEMELENGVGIESKHQTFYIKRTELPSEPVRDMELFWGADRYIVLHPGGGKVWEWADHFHSIYFVRAMSVAGGVAAQAVYGTPDGSAYGTPNDEPYGGPES